MTTTVEGPKLAAPTGDAMIDKDHADFECLLEAVQKNDDAGLAEGLAEIRDHMAAHFEREQQLMKKSGFPMFMVHRNEHQRVLAWADSIKIDLERGNIATVRQFLDAELPQWYVQHAATMDTATANWANSGELKF